MTKYRYNVFNKYIFRVPAAPFDSDLLKNITLHDVRRRFIEDTYLQEGIYLSSRSLYNEVQKNIDRRENTKLMESVLKYILRYTTRCTPFGLFAGISSVGKVCNSSTNIVIERNCQHKRFMRIDMGLLAEIVNEITQHKSIREKAFYYPNNTLYRVGNYWRYIESNLKNGKLTYQKSSIEDADYIQKIFSYCQNKVSFFEICNFLKQYGFDEENIHSFLNELIDNQILKSELDLSSIDEDPMKRLISLLSSHFEPINDIKIITFLKSISQLCTYKTTNQGDHNVVVYEKLLPNSIFPELPKDKCCYQTDIQIHTIHNELSKSLCDTLRECVDVYDRLSFLRENPDLENFKNKFLERYEYNDIPLLTVLDSDIGLGYPVDRTTKLLSPLIDDIRFESKKREFTHVIWNNKYQYLAEKLGAVLMSTNESVKELVLTEEELAQFELSAIENMPNALSALIEIYSSSQGTRIFCPGFSSPAASYIGRFAYCDTEIKSYIEEINKTENDFYDDVIFAEISHLPDSRVGNILLRPSLSSFEIPISSSSLKPISNQILLSDILVSIRNNQIILKSKRLNKRIIPRLTNAHNFNRPDNLPVYRFLCEIYNQTIKSRIGFDWGVFLNFPFLPRVVYKNIILAKARWSFKSDIFKSYGSLPDEQLMAKVKQWQQKNRVPTIVVLKEWDNKLYIDLSNVTLVRLMLSEIKSKWKFVLEEFPFVDAADFIQDYNGNSYVNEFVISLYKNI